MADAVSNGVAAVRRLGNRPLFLWLGKIFYGLLYRELFLLSDRTNHNSPGIVTVEALRKYETHLIFLQQVRSRIETVNFTPGSIFVFKAQNPTPSKLQWDFCDNFDTLCIGIRMGDVAVAAALADGEAQNIVNAFDDVLDLPLHPLQFREICAVICYMATLATRTPKYVTIEGNPHKTIQLPLGGFSLKPLFQGWDDDVYAHYLAHYTMKPFQEIRPSSDKIMTFLYGPGGTPNYIPYEEK